ncbi:MAG: phosphoenolpyruvate--protein phosphotransferase [Bacteroidales bacterium]|nr:phosphoenolpyruvate--protein phosphotransferase [Bacteroidales bacterium]
MVVRGPAYLWNCHPEACPELAEGRERRISFSEAYDQVRRELAAAAVPEPKAAEVFAAHLEILEDPMLKEAVEAELEAGKPELEALDAACSGICAMFSEIDDEYLRARVDDVRDVFGRLRNAMLGISRRHEVPAGSVIVAEELLPSDTAEIDFSSIAGILCRRGSSTSHVCIIAHSKGVPIQLGVDISGISDGDLVSVDDPMVGPSSIESKVRAAGRKLYVNAGSVDDIRAAIAAGADGIGLFRTEFLFLGRSAMPTREEQKALYKEALEACAGKPLTVRLLDVGGDKALPYLPMPREDNPFLGLRGVRFLLAHTELLEAQLGAIADAASAVPGSQVRVMIPMVCTVEEIRRVREMLNQPLELGIMVETPAAVLDAASLAAECDFFSIGTNDLTQYVMAADRGNSAVAGLYDPMSPAVRRAVELAVSAAHASGIPVGICGELASDPRATDFLLSAGLDSLSLSRL